MISLFASAVRPFLWERLLDSLKLNTIPYEVVFSGYIEPVVIQEILEKYPMLKYIQTKNIKPAQCYEIARRKCTGDIIGWISDDCEFPPNALDKIYEFATKQNDTTILAIKTLDPQCKNNDLNDHRFFARNLNTPQMAQIGFMNRFTLEKMHGIDRRYLYGKWEYDICMRLLAAGGKVIKFEEVEIKIDHTHKSGEYTNDWSGVNQDSEICENSWVIEGYKDFERGIYVLNHQGTLNVYYPISNREVTLQRRDKFEPFEDENITETSQSIRDRWE